MELFFGSVRLHDYLPSHPDGSIVLTTHNHKAVAKLDIPPRNTITAKKMSDAEGLERLQKNLKESQTYDRDSTYALPELLGYLHLAIKQASAYMAEEGMTTGRYLQHCRTSDRRLIDSPSHESEYQGCYQGMNNAIATTWLISFNHILRDRPWAAEIFRMVCFMVDKYIPSSLFVQGDDELEVDEAMGTLKAYAFITEREDQQSFDVHRLVQLATRNWLQTQGQQEFWIEETMQRLADIFPSPEHENREVWRQYLPHALSAVHCKSIRFREAEEMQRQTLDPKKKVFGEEHPTTLCSLNNLAAVLEQQGKYEEAEQMHRQTLDLRKKVLGEEHPSTLASMNNLAAVLRQQGKYEEAEQIFE
ncbi:hypothetical protein LTR96_011102 [Exophiala xenobiotica]|nr:hypothetical protein LTR96_011102 [Exophiala xenobiotica]KAK5332762.1 hypothetical protein LTR98_011134 [Exophiala xenobiotica]